MTSKQSSSQAALSRHTRDRSATKSREIANARRKRTGCLDGVAGGQLHVTSSGAYGSLSREDTGANLRQPQAHCRGHRHQPRVAELDHGQILQPTGFNNQQQERMGAKGCDAMAKGQSRGAMMGSLDFSLQAGSLPSTGQSPRCAWQEPSGMNHNTSPVMSDRQHEIGVPGYKGNSEGHFRLGLKDTNAGPATPEDACMIQCSPQGMLATLQQSVHSLALTWGMTDVWCFGFCDKLLQDWDEFDESEDVS